MRDGDDGESFFRGELGKRGQHAADDGVEVRIVRADEGVDGIDDNQAAIGDVVEGGFDFGEVVAEVGDRGEEEDAVRVGAVGVEAGEDGVGEVVVGVEEEDGGGARS